MRGVITVLAFITLAVVACGSPAAPSPTPTDTPIPPMFGLSAVLESTAAPDTIQPRLHGLWRRVNAEFINVPTPPFYVLGTELEFNDISNRLQERTADYYLEGDIEGWDCVFSGTYEVETVGVYHEGDGLEATGTITFSPLDLPSPLPWVSSCAYTPSSSEIPEVEGVELITPQPASAGTGFHIPVIATPSRSFEFEISSGGDVLTITVTLPGAMGDISRIYTYKRVD